MVSPGPSGPQWSGSIPRLLVRRERHPPSSTRRASARTVQAVAATGGPSAMDLAVPLLESVAAGAGADPTSDRPELASRRVPPSLETPVR